MPIYFKTLEYSSLDHQFVLGEYILDLHKEYITMEWLVCNHKFGASVQSTTHIH
jgi:hypothetical protein